MRKKSFELTKGEETLMEMFWDADHPLASMEICEMTDEFNDSYVHRLLTSLQKKGIIEVNGVVKSGKQYARTFVPKMEREQYAAFVIDKLGIKDQKALAKVAVALVQKSSDKENCDNTELVNELESIVAQMKKK